MRKIILFAAACFFLQISFAENNLPSPFVHQTYLIVQPKATITPFKTIQKRIPLKERLFMKWYKKKIQHGISEERKKKDVKLLGNLSLAAALLSVLLYLISFLAISEGVILAAGLFSLILMPVAVILGILSLTKRKKLADKKGTSKIPALLGLIIGGAFILIFLIALIDFMVNGFSFNLSW